MCCSFNKVKAERLFKSGRYREMLAKLQTRDKAEAFDKAKEDGMGEGEPYSEAGKAKVCIIKKAHKAGILM